MGFENLMQRAAQIRDLAIRVARRGLHEPDDGSDQVMRRIARQVEARAAGVPGLFQPFSEMPDPAKFDAAMGDLSVAMRHLSGGQETSDPIARNGEVYPRNPTLQKIDEVGSDLNDWTGVAAREFRSKFLTPLPAITHNQFILIAALKSALAAEQSMWKAARADIVSIADATYACLDQLNGCTKNDMVIAFTVAASVLAVPWTGTGSLGVTLAAIGAAASSSGADIAGLDAPKGRISGQLPLDVLNSMQRAVDFETQKIIETENVIRTAVYNLHNQIHEYQSSANSDRHAFCARRPSLAYANKNTIRNDMGYTY
jgi:hypothetical protein